MTRRSTDPESVTDDEDTSSSADAPPRDLGDADAFVQRVRALRAASKHLEYVEQAQTHGQSAARYHSEPRPAPKPGEDTPHDAKVLVALPPEQALLRERDQQARRVPTGPRLLAAPRSIVAPTAPRSGARSVPRGQLALGVLVALALGAVVAVVVARVVSSTPAASHPSAAAHAPPPSLGSNH
ncbi:MAG: hypothetical protein HOO96_30520 [Polyangiaceae bacterium]|nr:hypothetical protein [Polyangiaceae bacterium]